MYSVFGINNYSTIASNNYKKFIKKRKEKKASNNSIFLSKKEWIDFLSFLFFLLYVNDDVEEFCMDIVGGDILGEDKKGFGGISID